MEAWLFENYIAGAPTGKTLILKEQGAFYKISNYTGEIEKQSLQCARLRAERLNLREKYVWNARILETINGAPWLERHWSRGLKLVGVGWVPESGQREQTVNTYYIKKV